MNTRKHSKTLEKSRSWSQVNSVLIALGFSLTCGQAQIAPVLVTAPNSSNNQAATQIEINGIVAGLVAQVPVPEIGLLQGLYNTAKTDFGQVSADLNASNVIVNDLFPKTTRTLAEEIKLSNAQADVIRLEGERALLGQKITTLNPFVTESATGIVGSDIKLAAGPGRLQTGVDANTAQLKTIQDSVANYNGGIALSPNLEGTIDALKNTRVGAESGYQRGDTDQVRIARQNFEDNPNDITALRNYANSVEAQLQGYAPLDGDQRDQLVGEVLNGSWERTAINQLNTDIPVKIAVETNRATAAERALGLRLDGHNTRLVSAETTLLNHDTRLVSAETKLLNHDTRLVSAEANIQRLNRGIAMTAALVTPTIESGNNNAVSFTAAGYEGDTGFSLGYARRISGGLSANLGVASSDQFEEVVVRGGVNFSW